MRLKVRPKRCLVLPGPHAPQKVLENVVAKDLQTMLRPMNLLQTIFNYPKYSIRDGFIKPIGYKLALFSGLKLIAFLILNNMRIFIHTDRNMVGKAIGGYFNLMLVAGNINYILQITGFILNIINEIYHRRSNIKLVLKIQKIMKTCKFDKNTVQRLSFNNGFFAVVTFALNFILFAVSHLHAENWNFYEFAADLPLIGFDVNMFQAWRTAALLKTAVQKWHEKLVEINKSDYEDKESLLIEMKERFLDLLDALELYRVVFQDLILYSIIETFIHSIIYVTIWIMAALSIKLMTGAFKLFELTSVLMLLWLAKQMYNVTILAGEVEGIQQEMDSCMSSATQLLILDDRSPTEKKIYKNVRRLYSATSSPLSLRGLAELNTTLAVELAATVATSAVVLLQFALM